MAGPPDPNRWIPKGGGLDYGHPDWVRLYWADVAAVEKFYARRNAEAIARLQAALADEEKMYGLATEAVWDGRYIDIAAVRERIVAYFRGVLDGDPVDHLTRP